MRIRKSYKEKKQEEFLTNFWPVFVDAFATVIMVVTFLLTLFVITQHFLNHAMVDKDHMIQSFRHKITNLIALLSFEKKTKQNFKKHIIHLQEKRKEQKNQLDHMIEKVTTLNENVSALSMLSKTLEENLVHTQETLFQKDAFIGDLKQKLDTITLEKMQELSSYRSEFFGKLKEVVGNRQDVRIVGDRFVFQSEVLFSSGSAALTLEGKEQVQQLGNTLKIIAKDIPETIPWILRVDGHTDYRPIQSEKYFSNWELSFARAMAVVRELQKSGINPHHLAATGFAEHQPLQEGKSPHILKINRRIEFKLDSLQNLTMAR